MNDCGRRSWSAANRWRPHPWLRASGSSVQRPAQDLGAGPAEELLAGAVAVDDAPLLVDHDDQRLDLLGLPREAQPQVRRLGHVGDDAAQAARPAARLLDDAAAHLDPAVRAALGVEHAVPGAEPPVVGERLGEVQPQPRVVVRVQRAQHRLDGADVRAARAQQSAEPGVEGDLAADQVPVERPGAGRVEGFQGGLEVGSGA